MTEPTATSALLARTRAVMPAELRRALGLLDARNRRVASYHLGLSGPDGGQVPFAGGKMIRAALALAGASGSTADDGAAPQFVLAAATGIELIHQYSLLHDDIIDGDRSRRHRPTAWTVFGTDAAILAGDALASLGVEVVLGGGGPGSAAAGAAVAAASRRMVAGQAADSAFEALPAVSLRDCLAMVADKTGALIECAASVGAVAAGAPAATVAGLGAFGRHLGLAFQIVDDLIGLWGEQERTGKPVGRDITSRKKSLPVVAALGEGGPDGARLAEIYAAPAAADGSDVAAALAAIEAAGGRGWAEAEAARQTDAALSALAGAGVGGRARAELEELTVMLCRRDS